MTPPMVPSLLIRAVAPAADYESVIGDLHEEFSQRVASAGRIAANRWYWSQSLCSLPSLLSYSRSSKSLIGKAGTTLAVAVIVVAMMLCYDLTRGAISTVYSCTGKNDLCAWPYFLSGWVIAATFGAIITALFRSSVRLPLFASLGLVASIVIPTALGFSSALPLVAWLLLLSVVPGMSAGSAIYQLLRRR